MHVSVENTSNLGRRMTVAVPADRLEQAFSERLSRLSRNAKMDGFRPGKVPVKVVEQRYGEELIEEAAGELIQATFFEVVGQQGLKPAGGPTLERKSAARGRDLEYVVTFEVYPEVKRLDIKGARIERPVCEVKPADVDRTLESLRRQRLTWKPVERAARDGDRAIIDFTGSLDGEPIAGGTAKDFALVLGSESLIGDFERQLVGVRPGETRSLDVVFPADYRATELAGKTVRFEVTMKSLAEAELPAVDAEFAKAFGVGDGSVEALRGEIADNLKREMDERIRVRLRDQVLKAVLEANQLEVPRALVEREIEHLIAANRARLQAQGLPADRVPSERGLYEANAHSRVALGLILSEVAHAGGLKPDPERVRARVERLAASYEKPEEFVRWYYSDRNRLGEVEAQVVEDMVVEKLLESAAVVDRPVEFGELTNPAPSADK